MVVVVVIEWFLSLILLLKLTERRFMFAWFCLFLVASWKHFNRVLGMNWLSKRARGDFCSIHLHRSKCLFTCESSCLEPVAAKLDCILLSVQCTLILYCRSPPPSLPNEPCVLNVISSRISLEPVLLFASANRSLFLILFLHGE